MESKDRVSFEECMLIFLNCIYIYILGHPIFLCLAMIL